MKDTDIQIGKCYDIKVGKNLVAVRIMKLAEQSGWEAISLKNNNPVIIRSADRIVGPHNPKADKAAKVEEPNKDAKPAQEPAQTKRGGLSAAAQVLAEAKTPMNCKELVKAMFDQGLWNSEGSTPASTIYSAMIREIKAKGDASRFRKTNKGLFELAK
jgi:hypothetical protein